MLPSILPKPTLYPPPAATTASGVPPKPRVLRINVGARPDLLDPQRASTNGEIAVLQFAYEGLTRLDEKGRINPGAAEKWEFSADAKTLTFHLRSGLKRADSSPLYAKDFEYAFKHALDPRFGAMDPSFLDDIHGAFAAYTMDIKSKPEVIQKALENVGIKAVDESTLVFDFDQPAGYFPVIASTWLSFPIDRAKLETDPDVWWTKPENHNGNGPFRISEISEEVIKFVPNSNYWGGKAMLERVELYWIADSSMALQAYRRGQIDVVRVTADILAQVQGDPALNRELFRGSAAWVTYLGFNVKKAPFSDRNVRKAFSQALDREAFVREVQGGSGKPFLSLIPPGIPGYDESATVPGYDPQAAAKTLIDAGYATPDKKRVDCNKLGTVKLTYSTTPRIQSLFQFLAGNLTRVLACPVLLDPIDPATYPLTIKDPKTSPQVFLLTWQQEYAHPQNWLFLHTCSGVYASRVGYCNKDLDAVIAAANAETDYDASMAKYRNAQKMWINDLSAAILWNNENAFLIKPYIKGLRDHYSTGDNAFPGEYGTYLTYDIDLGRVGDGYPTQ